MPNHVTSISENRNFLWTTDKDTRICFVTPTHRISSACARISNEIGSRCEEGTASRWETPFEGTLDVWPLRRQCRTIHFHKSDVVRAGIQAQLPQPINVRQLGHFRRHRPLMVRSNSGMLFCWIVHKLDPGGAV